MLLTLHILDNGSQGGDCLAELCTVPHTSEAAKQAYSQLVKKFTAGHRATKRTILNQSCEWMPLYSIPIKYGHT
jgi:hypothetical protein